MADPQAGREPDDAGSVVERARRFLRTYTRGDLRFDEHIRPVRYVFAPDGRLVAPAMIAMLQTFDTALFVPEVAEGAMELDVTLEQLSERGPQGGLCDRWRIHHGEPEDVQWAFITVDAARFEGHVIDGEAFQEIDPLHEAEPALVRWINEVHRAALPELGRRFAEVGIDDPRAVAVDRFGVLLRGRFGCHRVPFDGDVPDETAARRAVEALVRTVREAAT